MTLRTRIIAGFLLILVLVVGLAVTVVVAQREQLTDQLDRRLDAIAPLDRPGAGQPRLDGPGRPTATPISDVLIGVVDSEGTLDVIVKGLLLDTVPDVADLASAAPTGLTFSTIASTDGSTRFRVRSEPNPDGDATSFVALPTTDVDETVRRLAISFVVVTMLVLVVLGLVAWWIVRLGLQPITNMTSTAHAIANGDTDRRSPQIDRRTEAGRLAEAFNVMLDQRDAAEAKLRRFVSDASHELRTPLTSIRGYLDLYEGGGFREPGELDDVVRRMSDEAHRMGALVEDLLVLARFDEAPSLAVEPTDVGALVQDVVSDALAGYPDRRIIGSGPLPSSSMAAIDRLRVKQLVALLIDNAITHAPDADVRVGATVASDELSIVVSDDGPGLDADQAPHVFSRFYRSDDSRARSTGGSGLGLAIGKSIVDAHGGTIELTTAPGEGCTFIVTIPQPLPARDEQLQD